MLPEPPGINWMPFIIVFVLVAGGFLVYSQSTWIGHLMREGPPVEDPLDKLTEAEARDLLEQGVLARLSEVGAEGKLMWYADGQETTREHPGNVELFIETELKVPEDRRLIVDPVKKYMPAARIPTLVMVDTKSNATWTYSVKQPAGQEGSAGDFTSGQRGNEGESFSRQTGLQGEGTVE